MQQINVIVTPKAKQTISVTVNGVAMSVVNSDGSYSTTHYSGTPFIIPNITVTDSDGSTYSHPSVKDVVCTPPVGADVENSDGSYTAHVNNGATLILPDTEIKNTAGAIILTQPSCTNTGVIADCRVVNSDTTYDKLVPAETTHNIPDIQFTDSDGSVINVPACKNIMATPCAGYSFQPETTAFWSRLSGTPDISWKYDFDMLVIALINAGIWGVADAMYLRAFENQADSLLKINGTGNNSTLVNSPAWVKGVGFTGNGSNRYINNNFNPTTHGVNYTQNSACFAQFIVTAGTGNYNGGIYSAGTTAISIPVNNGNVTALNGGFIASSAGSNYNNLIAVSRSNASDFVFFVDGNAYTKSNASLSIPNGDVYELAINAVPYGVSDGYVTSTVAFSYIGGALTTAQLQQLDGIIRWWLAKVASNP